MQNVVEMDPSLLANYWRLMRFYEQKGEFEKALQMREDYAKFAKEHARELSLQALLLRKAYASTGARGYWNQELQFLKTQKTNNVKGGACCDDAIGIVYARLGRREEAIRSLEQAFNDHIPYLIWELPASPDLNPLRSDPRFADLLARLLHRSE